MPAFTFEKISPPRRGPQLPVVAKPSRNYSWLIFAAVVAVLLASFASVVGLFLRS